MDESEHVISHAPRQLCISPKNHYALTNCKSNLGDENWQVFKAAWHSITLEDAIEQFVQHCLDF